MRKVVIIHLLTFLFGPVFFYYEATAQTLKLGTLLEMKSLPSKQFTGAVVNQGLWQIESASADSQHIVFSPVNALDNFESIEIKRRPLLAITYYTQDKAWFDTLKREAIRMRFRLLSKETITTSEILHTLQKDSAFIIEFLQTPSAMEIHLFSYQDYFRSFFTSPYDTWSRTEQFAFMQKCMSKMNQKLPFKYALKACGCGGQLLEGHVKYKFADAMNMDELMLLIKPCIVRYLDEIENQK